MNENEKVLLESQWKDLIGKWEKKEGWGGGWKWDDNLSWDEV